VHSLSRPRASAPQKRPWCSLSRGTAALRENVSLCVFAQSQHPSQFQGNHALNPQGLKSIMLGGEDVGVGGTGFQPVRSCSITMPKSIPGNHALNPERPRVRTLGSGDVGGSGGVQKSTGCKPVPQEHALRKPVGFSILSSQECLCYLPNEPGSSPCTATSTTAGAAIRSPCLIRCSRSSSFRARYSLFSIADS
jgi:hypothetical protein